MWVGLLFAPALLAQGVFYERDIHHYWHPFMACFRRVVQDGSWPLWNPYVSFGSPLLADPSLQLAYPPTWATLWVSPHAYFTGFVVLHCLGSGFGAYRLGRAWSLPPLPAFLSAVAWCSSGPFLSSVSVYHHYAGAAWIPWLLWALEKALASPSARTVVVLGLTAAGQLLAGSADMCIFTALAAAGRGVAYVLAQPRRARALRALGGVAGAGAALGFLLAAVQWIPSADLVRSSARPAHGLRTTTYWSLHPASLADTVVPNLVSGFPWRPEAREALFEGREPFLRCLYLGVVVAALGVLGLLAPAARPWLALALLAFFVLAALGRFTPARYLFLLPPLNVLRYSVKYSVPAALCASLLAGFGLRAWQADWSAPMRRGAAFLLAGLAAFGLLCLGAAVWILRHPDALLAMAAEGSGPAAAPPVGVTAARLIRAAEAALAILVLLWWRRRHLSSPGWLTAALVALCLVDVGSVARHINPLVPRAVLEERPGTAGAIPPGERAYSAPQGIDWLHARFTRVPAGWDPGWAAALGARQRLSPPTGVLWGLRGSYDGDFTGLALPGLGRLSQLVAEERDQPVGTRLLRMGGVGRAVSLEEMPGLALLASFPSVYTDPVRVYQVPSPAPAAYWVGRARIASEPESYAIVAAPGFDFMQEAVLAPPAALPPSAGTRGQARVIEAKADRLALEVEADGPGFLVVVEAFNPGWRAQVDGRAAPVLRANTLFRAVALDGGRQRVELRYRPPAVAWGLALSALALLLAAAAWALGAPPVASPDPPR